MSSCWSGHSDSSELDRLLPGKVLDLEVQDGEDGGGRLTSGCSTEDPRVNAPLTLYSINAVSKNQSHYTNATK